MILLIKPHTTNEYNHVDGIIYLCTNKSSTEILKNLEQNVFVSDDDGVTARPDDPFLLSYIYAN